MKFTKSEHAKGIFGTFLIIVIIGGYTFEIPHFSNTFGIKSLILYALGLGFVSGLLGGWFLSKKTKNSLEKFQIIIGAVFIGLVVMPLSVSYTHLTLPTKRIV